MILFMDGMSHYATDQIDKKYTVVDSDGGNAAWAIAAEGRFNNALTRTASWTASGGYVEVAPLMTQESVWTPSSGGVWGTAFKISDLDVISTGGTNSVQRWFDVRESGFPIFHVSLNANGTFSAYRSANGAFGVNGVLLATSVQGIRENIWHYIEIKWNIGEGDGFVQIRVNEVPVLNYGIDPDGTPTTGDVYGTNTNYPYSGVWTSVRYGNVGDDGFHSLSKQWYCDTYLADLEGAGDQIRDFLGDVTIDKIVPDGIGNDTDWTPLAGDNWDNVEEVPPDDDTTYVESNTLGDRDSHTMQDVPAGTVPLAFQALVYIRKDSEGLAAIKPTFRSNGTTYDANTQGVATPDEYRYILQPYDTNPDTAATITESELNAAEFGYVKVS